MKRYTDQEISSIKELRMRHKYSYAYLSRLFNIPQTTIGHWFRENEKISKSETLLNNHIRKRMLVRKSEVSLLSKFENISPETAKLWVALLYWCEGSKYPASNSLTFVNSDPSLIATFVQLLRIAFLLDESKFSVHLQIHTTHKFESVRAYWSNLLGIQENQFMRPTITSPNGKKRRAEYQGTCTVKYHDYRLLLKLMGLYEAFAKKVVSP